MEIDLATEGTEDTEGTEIFVTVLRSPQRALTATRW